MKEVFIKKYWKEGDVLFYLHFQNGVAIRQIEITSNAKLFLTSSSPQKDNSMLYDQSIDELDLEETDFITEDHFNKIWNER
ncbi:hypothetical protein [Solitalea canadensis]|uniref:Uncharacterized protein n=1 Tax=Solitalea canadensis (strain ATCC 29591 / DSM 3403 / JCM 21819 / LMG 8368 / NBRC 15130 / NCIMB 12057 / USAM 9D) TaxID=929556 RepID=H8KUP3_SOLCM|nr:hypothetical protein [Solitalea canadensis]AFD07527.1 hypothetical protein Solca_2492 [Solitalea canadensis DSM 3403]